MYLVSLLIKSLFIWTIIPWLLDRVLLRRWILQRKIKHNYPTLPFNIFNCLLCSGTVEVGIWLRLPNILTTLSMSLIYYRGKSMLVLKWHKIIFYGFIKQSNPFPFLLNLCQLYFSGFRCSHCTIRDRVIIILIILPFQISF